MQSNTQKMVLTPKRVQRRETGGAAESSEQPPGACRGLERSCQHPRCSTWGGLVEVGGSQRRQPSLSPSPFLHSRKILDSELFELMHQNGDYTHFYFCYRWFLLDFKRGKRWVRWWVTVRSTGRSLCPKANGSQP